MDTSGESTLSIVLQFVVLAAGIQVAARQAPLNRRWPIVAAAATIVIGVPSLLQFPFPAISAALSRQPDRERAGEWWRLLTAILAQDGGIGGAIFGLIVVGVVVVLAERAWGRWRTVILFLVPSVVLNALAVLWNAPGGGSSFASDGLLFSVCSLALLTTRRTIVIVLSAIAFAAALILVAAGDAHGLAMVLGAVLGLAFGYRHKRLPPGASESGSAPPIQV